MAGWVGWTGDPVLDWFGEADGDGLAKAAHLLVDKVQVHPHCKCRKITIEARGELWEVTQTTRNAPYPCAECLAREKIWRWLAETGHPAIRVERLAQGVELATFMRVYSYLRQLVERNPKAVPAGGIALTFDLSSQPQEYGAWREREHRLNLSGEYFATAATLLALGQVMAGYEHAGENPRGCRTPEYIISHEYAHCLLWRLDTAKYDTWWRCEDPLQICDNAVKKASEGFADGFAMILHIRPGGWPPAVKALHQMLREDGVLR